MNTISISISGSSTDPAGTVAIPNLSGNAPLTVTFIYTDELFQQQSAAVVKTILDCDVAKYIKNAKINNSIVSRTTYTTLVGDIAKSACSMNDVVYTQPGTYNTTLTVIYGDWKVVTYTNQVTVGSATVEPAIDSITLADTGEIIVSFTDKETRTNSMCVFN